MQFLQTVLSDLNAGEIAKNFASNFWNLLGNSIVDEFKKAPVSTQQIFETEYPKLLKCFSEMTIKLNYNNYLYKLVVSIIKLTNTYF